MNIFIYYLSYQIISTKAIMGGYKKIETEKRNGEKLKFGKNVALKMMTNLYLNDLKHLCILRSNLLINSCKKDSKNATQLLKNF